MIEQEGEKDKENPLYCMKLYVKKEKIRILTTVQWVSWKCTISRSINMFSFDLRRTNAQPLVKGLPGYGSPGNKDVNLIGRVSPIITFSFLYLHVNIRTMKGNVCFGTRFWRDFLRNFWTEHVCNITIVWYFSTKMVNIFATSINRTIFILLFTLTYGPVSHFCFHFLNVTTLSTKSFPKLQQKASRVHFAKCPTQWPI